MIRSFADKETERVWNGDISRRLPNQIQALARRKLRMLDAAQRLDDLRIPPANRLEALKGKRSGQHSIRINDQWRICFVWHDGQCDEVEIADYH
ncbi:MAG: type II toxin-antitoxin system RelE/ParE family toxin [Betaproteobacteria bacterium]|nr:MAG: type II toxin-antitoxin system RelE/ParE family toxin [Betaproteobacteria bacterium]